MVSKSNLIIKNSLYKMDFCDEDMRMCSTFIRSINIHLSQKSNPNPLKCPFSDTPFNVEVGQADVGMSPIPVAGDGVRTGIQYHECTFRVDCSQSPGYTLHVEITGKPKLKSKSKYFYFARIDPSVYSGFKSSPNK